MLFVNYYNYHEKYCSGNRIVCTNRICFHAKFFLSYFLFNSTHTALLAMNNVTKQQQKKILYTDLYFLSSREAHSGFLWFYFSPFYKSQREAFITALAYTLKVRPSYSVREGQPEQHLVINQPEKKLVSLMWTKCNSKSNQLLRSLFPETEIMTGCLCAQPYRMTSTLLRCQLD